MSSRTIWLVTVLVCLLVLNLSSALASSIYGNGSVLADAKELQIRNPYQAKHYVESTHFVFWYDDEFLGQEYLFDAELARMEANWVQLIDIKGFSAPVNDYKMNIYLGNAGSDTLPWGGWSGQATLDDEDYSFIVLGPQMLSVGLMDIQYHSGHEFFHTIQFEYDPRYARSPNWAWFVESTASWGGVKAWEDENMLARFVWLESQRPDLSLHQQQIRLDASTEFTVVNSHQYGVGLFHYYLELVTDEKAIKYTLQAIKKENELFGERQPLELLSETVATEYNTSLKQVFAQYAARLIHWDFSFSHALKPAFEQSNITQRSRFVKDINGPSSQWHAINNTTTDMSPRNWGAAYLHVNVPTKEDVVLSFQATDNFVNRDTDWIVTAVIPGDTYRYIDVNTVNGVIDAQTLQLEGASEFWLSITPFKNYVDFERRHYFNIQIAKKGEQTPYSTATSVNTKTSDQNSGSGSVFYLLLCIIFVRRHRFVVSTD